MRFIIISLMLALTVAAFAAPGVNITIYNDNLALVRDVRDMEFPRGIGEVFFRDVAGQIDATSVHFHAPGVQMLEQNFDYDLVSTDKLMLKYIDEKVQLVTEDGNVFSGTLLFSSYKGFGEIIIQDSRGQVQLIQREQIRDISFPSLPEGLITRPTLRWLVDAPSEGARETEVSYLTGGIEWRADYVAVVSTDDKHLNLAGWVTINNKSGATYKDAKVKLMAGEVHRAQPQQIAYNMLRTKAGAMEAAAPQFEEKAFFEYHLYTLQRPSTIADNQTKQLSLFPPADVEAKRIYEYDYRRDAERVRVSFEFENSQKAGLGMALPAGRVRVYMQDDDGAQEFVGEDNIDHTPKDEKVRVAVGKAFDIVVERQQTDMRRISDRVREENYEVKLRNHKDDAVEISVLDYFWGDWHILNSSLPYTKKSSRQVEFKVPVKPDEEVVLTYRVRITY
ncbi:DUF4139 domain-containing protein [bacterium]|nr:DUF4139 domain-containing protein [bacterium]